MATERDPAGPDLRYEVKSVAPITLLPAIRTWMRLHPAAFGPHHPPRTVNSVYFDTPDLFAFRENLSGVGGRRKLRFRWYGETSDSVHGTLELKCKQTQLGWKVNEKLAEPIDLRAGSWRRVMREIDRRLTPAGRRLLADAGPPATLIRYRRSYHLSGDRLIRVTIDTDLTSIDQRGAAAPRLDGPRTRDDLIVVEVKASADHRRELERALSVWPLPVSRNSKFVRAMARASS